MTTDKVWYVAVKKELPEEHKNNELLIPGTRVTTYYSKLGIARAWISRKSTCFSWSAYVVIEADLINHKELV